MKIIIIAGLLGALPLAIAVGEESAQAASKIAEDSSRVLLDAKSFIIGKAFEEGRITKPETELRELVTRKDAMEQLRTLLKEASLPGQLYALLGLRLLGSGEFDAAYDHLKDSTVSVPTMSGCLKYQITAGEVAEKIKQGTIK